MKIMRIDDLLWLRFGFNRKLIDFVKKLEMARWNPEKKMWSIKDSERNINALKYFATGRLTFPCDNTITFARSLYQHQKDMVNFFFNHELNGKCKAYWAATMGVGKTLAAIEVMERSGTSNWWYIAPKSALLSVRIELRKWDSFITPRFMTYEGMVKAVREGGDNPDGVIFDECHKLKTPTSIRTQAAIYLAQNTNKYILMMTGTPAPKDPTDWYSQIELLYPGFIMEGNIHKFKRRIAEIEEVDLSEDENSKSNHSYMSVIDWKEDEIKIFREEIKSIVLSVDKDECLDLPDKIYIEHKIEPDSVICQRYSMLLNSSKTTIEALNRCRQLSDGFIYFEDKSMRVKNNPKLEAIEDLVTGKNRIVIFAGFTESIDLVCEKMNELKWEVLRIDGRGFKGDINRFMDRKIDRKIAIVAHPKSGGTGLTLTASDTIIYYSNDFDGESRMQSEDRIHRPGMTGANIIDLIHLPTDKYVLTKLKNKEKLQRITLKEMKLELEEADFGR